MLHLIAEHDEYTSLEDSKKKPLIHLSKVTSHSGPLNKTITLENGKIIKTANAQLTEGTVQTLALDCILRIEQVVNALQSNEALILGVPDVPSCKLTLSSKLTPEFVANGYRSRTKEHFALSERGLILFDYDEGEHQPYKLRCNTPAEVMAKLAAIPELAGLEYMGLPSSSAGITINESGQPYPKHGLHIYLECQGIDIEQFRQWLEVALWNAGLGYISFARNGAMLVRFIIDISVLSPERIVFEALPTLGPGLTQAEREFDAVPGRILTGNFVVTQQQLAEYHADVEQQKALGSVKAKSAKIRDVYIAEHGEVLAKTRDIPVKKARDIVRRNLEQLEKSKGLDNDYLLDMGTHYITVGELLASPTEYDGRAMPDPIEGRAYGTTTAKFYYNNGQPIINSFAHGVKTIYKLSMNDTAPSHSAAGFNSTDIDGTASGLDRFALNGLSAEMAERVMDEMYLMPNVILLGQSTAIYAAPNSGKTLIILAAMKEAVNRHPELKDKIHYINADDSAAGLVEKLRFAEECGFNMLAPGENGFEIGDTLRHLDGMCAGNQAAGQVVILDTLKKFTDLMNKSECSNFGKVIRRFVQKGGTVILLGHTNKRLGTDGKPIPEGTSDIINDADCVYRMYEIERDDDAQVKVVKLERIKARGNVTDAAYCRYSTAGGITYGELLESLERLDDNYAHASGMNGDSYNEFTIIAAVEAAITAGFTSKMQLRDEVATRCNISKRQALAVIDKYTGTDPSTHRWTFKRLGHGRHQFTVLSS